MIVVWRYFRLAINWGIEAPIGEWTDDTKSSEVIELSWLGSWIVLDGGVRVDWETEVGEMYETPIRHNET